MRVLASVIAALFASTALAQTFVIVQAGKPQQDLVYAPTDTSPAASSVLFQAALTSTGCQLSPIASDSGPNMSLTRATAAYMIDGSTNCSSGQGRVDSNGLTIEPARTNIALQSQTMNNASWVPLSASGKTLSVTTDATAAPDGTTTAEALVFGGTTVNGAGQYNILRQSLTPASSTRYTFSVWLKSPTISSLGIYLSNGTSYVIQGRCAVTSNWTRCSATGDSGTVGAAHINIGEIYDTDSQTLAAGTVYAWGAQLEAGAYATGYIPTTSASVARNRDIVTASDPALSGAGAEGSFKAVYTPDGSTTGMVFGSNTPVLFRLTPASGSGSVDLYQVDQFSFNCRWINTAGVSYTATATPTGWGPTAPTTFRCSWKATGQLCASFSVGGTNGSSCTNLSGTGITVSSFYIGNNETASDAASAGGRLMTLCLSGSSAGCP